VIIVGSNTLGAKTDIGHTQSSKTKWHGGGEDRCEETREVLSVGQLEHLAPPPFSLITFPFAVNEQPPNQPLVGTRKDRRAPQQQVRQFQKALTMLKKKSKIGP
jgi:hypothetical protein